MKNRQGIVITSPDKDVKRANPNEFAAHTDYPTLNLKVDDVDPNQGVINILFIGTGQTPGRFLLYRKVLDPTYPQLYYFAFNQSKGTAPLGAQYGKTFNLDLLGDRQFVVEQTGNIVEFYFINNDFTSPQSSLQGFSYQFQFAFYVNEGIQP